ncbi:hypothetical protein [Geodermatophilus sp. CPCC 206100]|uniref:hypothetical protein n=1 Tax=Geodermatophilus sp. CPCC 206100 TaxID=3020054 RepID=UPI003B002DC1
MTRSDDATTARDGGAPDSSVRITVDGHVLADADVHPTDDPRVVHSDLHVESGQLPLGTRGRLVDAVLDHPSVDRAERLVATMPISDTEMLDRVRERTTDVAARAAGATKIVEARLPHSD